MGIPAFQVTPEMRLRVKELSAFGVRQEDICGVIGCAWPALHKYFRKELDFGSIEANARVAQTLFQMATSGEHPAATFFWLKTRAKWREVSAIEVTGKDGAPLLKPASEISDDELAERIARGDRAGSHPRTLGAPQSED